jgi:hypothetical protein
MHTTTTTNDAITNDLDDLVREALALAQRVNQRIGKAVAVNEPTPGTGVLHLRVPEIEYKPDDLPCPG